MCGIAGIIGLADRERAQRMAAAIAHRGPDDEGIEIFPAQPAAGGRAELPAVSLAFRRLSILDLSPRGHQPMFNEDRSVCIVFNGEVYNFAELRKELEGKHQFRSGTDTEVIIHAYEEWGIRCVEKFRGMFAFALWDARRGRLWMARDRLGIKPLYWCRTGGKLVFGSEMKSVLASGLVERRLNMDALNRCLAYGCLRAPWSMLSGVQMLPPGHTLTMESGGEPVVERYWQLPADVTPLCAGQPQLTRQEVVTQLRALLEESIRLHMISDVPLGAFLSGGLDSTVIVGLMSRMVDQPIRTVCIGYGSEGAALNELGYARIAAEHFGCDHTEAIISGADAAREFDSFIWHLDRPSVDGLNSYFVSKITRQSVTVSLSGIGGDELFLGYPSTLATLRSMQLRARIPMLERLPRNLRLGRLHRLSPWMAALELAPYNMAELYERNRTLFDARQRAALIQEGARRLSRVNEPAAGSESLIANADMVNYLTRTEIERYMTPMLLRDMDAVSMAHALEVRPPFLDHKLVEFVCRLPGEFKLGGGRIPKPLLADAVADLVPPAVLHRPKAFFHMPISVWMQNELRDRVEDATCGDTVRKRGLFRPEAVAAVRQQVAEHPRNWPNLWLLTVMEWWMRRYLDAAS
ncbi:MAG: asparagine synthase (glutamine-hydrolyzing) [Verrucomicrobia bacterium]|nr:asparagine synthase (glutamine-hydrolyzing) [Verrucomicrobiota bacterium]